MHYEAGALDMKSFCNFYVRLVNCPEPPTAPERKTFDRFPVGSELPLSVMVGMYAFGIYRRYTGIAQIRKYAAEPGQHR